MARLAEGLRVLMEPDPARRHPSILYIERAIQSSAHFYLVIHPLWRLARAVAGPYTPCFYAIHFIRLPLLLRPPSLVPANANLPARPRLRR